MAGRQGANKGDKSSGGKFKKTGPTVPPAPEAKNIPDYHANRSKYFTEAYRARLKDNSCGDALEKTIEQFKQLDAVHSPSEKHAPRDVSSYTTEPPEPKLNYYDPNEATARETTIVISGEKPMSYYVGRPYSFVTYEGDTIEGTTDVDDSGSLIVQFPSGKWAYARTRWAN